MQSYVTDVGTERRPDGSYEYEIVIWTVPRQTGKTTGLRATGTHRAMVLGRDCFYTAQTGKHARARWMELVELIAARDAYRGRYSLSLRGGSECIAFKNGAGFHAFAPTEDSLHSYTPPCVFIDEAFKLAPGSGELLMGAAGPGQLTIVDKQIWIVSTAGTAASVFLHDWIDKAIAGAPRVAIFDWGCRDDQDPYSLADIAAFHPGVGYDFNGKTLTASDVLAEAEKHTRAEYERAYANRRTVTASHLIALDEWAPLRHPAAVDVPEACTLTYDVGADRQGSTLIAAWKDTAGVVHGSVIAAAAGVAWLPDAVEGARRLLRPATIAAAENGPVLEVTSTLRARGHDIRTVSEREFATAAGALLTNLAEGTLRHDGNADGSDVLSRSVLGLVTRAGAVDGVAFSRRHSVGDSSAGIAYALGTWLAGQQATAKPFVKFAS